jgi:hypothetical protein
MNRLSGFTRESRPLSEVSLETITVTGSIVGFSVRVLAGGL